MADRPRKRPLRGRIAGPRPTRLAGRSPYARRLGDRLLPARLAGRLALVVSLVIGASLAGSFWAVDQVTGLLLNQSRDTDLTTQVREWRRFIRQVPIDGPADLEQAATRWLDQQRDHPSTQIQVVDVAGGRAVTNRPSLLERELAHERGEQQGSIAPLHPDRGVLDAPEGLSTATSVGIGPVRVITDPVTRNGRLVGMLRVADPLSGVSRSRQQTRQAFLALGGLGVLIGALLGALVAVVVVRPLRRLNDLAAAVDAGDLDRRSGMTGGRDEISTLGRGFDRMLDRLQAAFARQRQFASDASHELRTPLSVMRAQVELLDRERGEAARQSARRLLLRRLDELDRLVGDLLVLARAEAGRLHDPRPVDVTGFFADLSRDLPLLGDRDYRVSHPGGTLQADPDRLTQVLRNLVRNAVNHTEPGQRISVTATAHDDHLTVGVADTGPGLPDGELANVFERFYRAEPDRRRDQGSTGLGLPIARALVEAHGGRIWARSAPSEGFEVLFDLPGYRPEPLTTI